jgi:ribosomal-protein-alanine N-acetyltransferase
MFETDLGWIQKTEDLCYKFTWTKTSFTKVLDNGIGYVMCDVYGKRLGYACYLSVLDEIHLLNIAVHPDYQKQGIAKQFLIDMRGYFKDIGFKSMLLEVRASNKAINLYKKINFKQDGIRKNYYPLEKNKKEDAVLMSYQLSL